MVRSRVFTKAFYEKHFAGVHPPPDRSGYPDTVRQTNTPLHTDMRL